MVPPAATEPAANRGSYPYFFISGRATSPMVAEVARLEPLTAANPVAPPMPAMARPPLNRPSHFAASVKRSVPRPLTKMILAMRRKRGRTARE